MAPFIFKEAVKLAEQHDKHTFSRLVDDIEAIGSGRGPTSVELTNAPLLDNWVPLLARDHVSLAGRVTGHPIRRDGLIVTSMLCAIEGETFRWARTVGRWYRLGRHFGKFEIEGRYH